MEKGRVLLASGDPDVTRTLQVYLEAHQLSVQTAKRGSEALAVCRQSPPDAVILDWHLPDMDGDDLCQKIRTNPATTESFILVLLAANQREAKLAALEAGADDVHTLPIDIEDIRLRIEEILN
jgi:DNA-binding response OmpR family regulator